MTQAANLGALGTNAGTTGVLASAGMPAGTVLQVINANMGAPFSTSSTSWVDVGFSASITPKFSTSKILILFNSGGVSRPGVANECMRLQILRGSSVVYGGGNLYFTSDSMSFSDWPSSMQYLDSPATTSSTTYKIQMQTRLGNSCTMNSGGNDNQFAVLTLLEIAQ
jgi:hypothetical protein